MCRPILDPIASIFHKLFCGRSARSEGTGQALDGSQFPGSGSIEANRRRCGSPSLIILGSSLKPFGSSSTCCLLSYPLITITNMISTHWLAWCSVELEPPNCPVIPSSIVHHIWSDHCPFLAEKGVRERWSRDWQRSWPQSGARKARPRHHHRPSSWRMMLLIKSEPSFRLVEFKPALCICWLFLRMPLCERDSGKWSSSQAWQESWVVSPVSSVAKGRRARRQMRPRVREPIVARQRAVFLYRCFVPVVKPSFEGKIHSHDDLAKSLDT